MPELLTSAFVTHHPSWADIHTLTSVMFTERRVDIDKARDKEHQLHLADPDGTPEANLEVPDFPGGPVVKNPLASAEDMGSITGPGSFCMLWGN